MNWALLFLDVWWISVFYVFSVIAFSCFILGPRAEGVESDGEENRSTEESDDEIIGPALHMKTVRHSSILAIEEWICWFAMIYATNMYYIPCIFTFHGHFNSIFSLIATFTLKLPVSIYAARPKHFTNQYDIVTFCGIFQLFVVFL